MPHPENKMLASVFVSFAGADGMVCSTLLHGHLSKGYDNVHVYGYVFGSAQGGDAQLGDVYICGAGMPQKQMDHIVEHSDSVTWLVPNVPDDYAVNGVEIVTHQSHSDAASKLVWNHINFGEAAPELIEIILDAEMGHCRLPLAAQVYATCLTSGIHPELFTEDGFKEGKEHLNPKGYELLIDMMEAYRDPDREEHATLGKRFLVAPDPFSFQMAWLAARIVARADDEPARVSVPLPTLGISMQAIVVYEAGDNNTHRSFSGASLYDAEPNDQPTDPDRDNGRILDASGKPILSGDSTIIH